MTKATDDKKSQADKFREAAREHETDDSEERLDKIVKRIAKTSSKEVATNRAGRNESFLGLAAKNGGKHRTDRADYLGRGILDC